MDFASHGMNMNGLPTKFITQYNKIIGEFDHLPMHGCGKVGAWLRQGQSMVGAQGMVGAR